MKIKQLFALLALSLLLASCAPRAFASLPPEELCEIALASLEGGGENFLPDTVGVTEDYFPMPDYVTSHIILYDRETDCIDEIGIFCVEEGHADALAACLRERYLAPAYEKNRDFYNSYIPNETPKLQNARVECYGNTVVYAILSPKEQSTLFSAVKKALTEK